MSSGSMISNLDSQMRTPISLVDQIKLGPLQKYTKYRMLFNL